MTATATRKPSLPQAAHIQIAAQVTAAIADAPMAVVDSLPPRVKESLDYFREVTEVAERITSEQPEVLAEYRQDILNEVEASDPEAAAIVDALLSSNVMARLLADAAAGNIEPVAVTAKARPAAKTTQKATAKKTAAPAAEKPADKAPKTDKTAKKATATPAAPEPGTDPADSTDPFGAPTDAEPVPASGSEPKSVGHLYPTPADDDF